MNRLLQWIVALMVPYTVIMAPVRATMRSWIVPFEYSLPGFPTDPVETIYPGRGMKPAERLRLGIEGLRGTVEPDGSSILRAMRFDDGSAAFDAREVKHLDDVRAVINVLFPIHTWVTLAFVVASVLLALRNLRMLGTAWRAGALFTIALIVAICAFAVIGWEQTFTAFHQLFFSGDSWLFNWDDTLIRLYPVEFWQIVTGILAMMIALLCAALYFGGGVLARRSSATR